VPGPLDFLVKEFEEWKATLPKVKFKRNFWQPLKNQLGEEVKKSECSKSPSLCIYECCHDCADSSILGAGIQDEDYREENQGLINRFHRAEEKPQRSSVLCSNLFQLTRVDKISLVYEETK